MTTNGDDAAPLDPAARLPSRIRARRRALGLSQEEVARRTGVTLRTWQRWEAGSTKGHVVHLPAMAQALETTPEELLGMVDPQAAPRGLDDLAMEQRLRSIESTQLEILRAVDHLRGALGAIKREEPRP